MSADVDVSRKIQAINSLVFECQGYKEINTFNSFSILGGIAATELPGFEGKVLVALVADRTSAAVTIAAATEAQELTVMSFACSSAPAFSVPFDNTLVMPQLKYFDDTTYTGTQIAHSP